MKRAVASLCLLALLGGCGVGAQTAPQVIAKAEVPPDLESSASTAAGPFTQGELVSIYLQSPHRLVAVHRTIPMPATPRAALAALLLGATTFESDEDLRSPVSAAAPIGLGRMSAGTATVRLSTAFAELAGSDQIIAASQIVFTLTGFPGIRHVRFTLGGKPIDVPTDGGRLKAGPVDRKAYASLAPR